MKNNLYDISTLGLEPQKIYQSKVERPHPFDYEAKYKELLALAVTQQKEIEQLKEMNRKIIANMNLLAEVVNGRSKV